eukprot:5130818-Pyramimonas_sp.AAC.1
MSYSSSMKRIFSRRLDHAWREYIIATDDELEEEKRWASSRPGARARYHPDGGEVDAHVASFHDHRDSFLGMLTIN